MQALEKAGSYLRLTKMLHLERDLDLSLDLERGDLERYRSRDLDLERRGDRDLDLSLCTCQEEVKDCSCDALYTVYLTLACAAKSLENHVPQVISQETLGLGISTYLSLEILTAIWRAQVRLNGLLKVICCRPCHR